MTEENGKYELLIQKLVQRISEKEYEVLVHEIELESAHGIIQSQTEEIEKLKKTVQAAVKKIEELTVKPENPENEE